MTARRFHRLVDAVQWMVGLAAMTAIVMLFSLDGAPPGDEAPVAGESSADAIALGREVYAEWCAACHGVDGGGGTGPDLGSVVETYPDPGAQRFVVAAGRGLMPAFGAQLDDEEIAAVVAFTRLGFR